MFVGREREAAALEAGIAAGEETRMQVVHGLGGVGKTTLAAYVAARSAHTRQAVWWIQGETPETISTGLADFARALQPALSALPADTLHERALEWFRTHRDWLIVLDNVDSPDDVARLIPRLHPNGRVLVTTRISTGWGDRAEHLRIRELEESAAVALFRRISTSAGDDGSDSDAVLALCRELGHLPLAIAQAAAFCRATFTGPYRYLEMLHNWTSEMLASSEEGWAPERTVARVWRISLDRLDDVPLAADLLGILAWYAPNGIPLLILDALGRRREVARALEGLAAHSLISQDSGGISVHPLVQATARTPDASDPHRAPERIRVAHERAVDLLLASLPGDVVASRSTLASWRTLAPHVDHLAAHTSEGSPFLSTALLCAHTGIFQHEQGSVQQAVALLRRAVDGMTAILGEDHPDRLAVTHNLAGAYVSAGHVGRAVEMYEYVRERQAQLLGPDHPDTIVTAGNLAHAYQSLGDISRALDVYQYVLETQLRVLGEAHPQLFVTRQNLASAYASAGDLERSVAMYESLLADQLHALGPDHPYTLGTENNLAAALASKGDLIAAFDRYTQLLADQSRVLGDDHPETITTRGNLGYVHILSGSPDEAVQVYERVLQDQTSVLGDDDPRTLASRNSLGIAYGATDPDRAIALLEQVLADRERVLGEDHPDTLTSRGTLAFIQLTAGRVERAMPLLERTASERARVLGGDHPDTLASQHDLAEALRLTGHHDRATTLFERALGTASAVLGEEHQLTHALRKALSSIQGER
ncbi:tetratricopeptide repeat protein [Streptomyces rubiginosohelvolus]|uniref:tetratricopeptide repeat protein n=1 Tax=Streptomyces rubiginosohelvolus TaxID=67362 RepID=UPI0037F17ED2